MMMRVLHCIESLSAVSGGPSRTVPALCDALAGETGLDVILCSQIMTGETPMAAAPDSRTIRRLVPGDVGLRRRFGRPLSRLMARTIAEEKPAIIHDHGLWTPLHHDIANLCRRYRLPLVLHPRGMLETKAMERHFLRKKIVWFAYVKRDLQAVSLFVATSEREVESIRRCGFRQPVAYVPNGVVPPDAEALTRLRKLSPPLAVRVALFIGRIHPIKGLLNLIDAWHVARPVGWRLVLAGPDEGGHRRQVEEKISTHGLSSVISFTGEVRGAEKTRLFGAADLFILPSFSENFGVAVAEALAYGLPVITTTGTPWRELREYECGWWIAPDVGPLSQAISEACAMPDAALGAMGQRGRILAARYDWQRIASQTAAAYHWLLHGGTRPDWVYNY